MNEYYPTSPESANNEVHTDSWTEMAKSMSQTPEELTGNILDKSSIDHEITSDQFSQTSPNFEKPKLGVIEDFAEDAQNNPEDVYTEITETTMLDENLPENTFDQASPNFNQDPDTFPADLPDEIFADDDFMQGFDQTPTLDQFEDLPPKAYPDMTASSENSLNNPLSADAQSYADINSPSNESLNNDTSSLEDLTLIPETLDTNSDQTVVNYILEQIANDHDNYQPEDLEAHHELDQITEIFSQVMARLSMPENETSVTEILDQLSNQYTAQAELATTAALERENLQKAELALEWQKNYADITEQSNAA